MSPAANRIAEIGVVTVDGDRVDLWTTLLNTSSHRGPAMQEGSAPRRSEGAPSFGDIATELAQRLSGRLMVAHNARFDHAFLRAEFDRVGVVFNPNVLCSVMLSRKLYPHLAHHDLDSLIECHGLCARERHRALPDADLVWHFRLDQATGKALEYAHRITNITWRATRGMLGAQLHAAALEGILFAAAKRKMSAAFTWQLSPSAVPSVAVVPFPDGHGSRVTQSFGIFPSERNARNALIRLATTHRLCHCLLGLCGIAEGDCLACPVNRVAPALG